MLVKVGKISFELNVTQNEYVKLYRVPTDYSSDGLYVAQWKPGEIEPYPACLGSNAHLIADGRIEKEMDSEAIKFSGKILEDGVEFNA